MFRQFRRAGAPGSLNAAWPEIALKTQLVHGCLPGFGAGGKPATWSPWARFELGESVG
jgi:hypothetical protein